MTAAGNADHKGLVVLFLLFLAIGGALKHQFGSHRLAPVGAGAPAGAAGRTPVKESTTRLEPPAQSAPLVLTYASGTKQTTC